MSRISLLGGSYQSRSLIASAQPCVNLFPETAPQTAEAPTPVAHLLTPGLTLAYTTTNAMVRALYRCANGLRLAVVGTTVYALDLVGGSHAMVGAINAGTAPVFVKDNGTVAVIVDGSASGWYVNIALNGFGLPADNNVHTIADPAFYGSPSVGYLDGYFVFAKPNTNQFYLSPYYWNGTTAFDATYIASKTGGQDPIGMVAVVNGYLWLIGLFTSEVWYDAGGATFPFARLPGVFLEHGIYAAASLAVTDTTILFLERDASGNSVVLRSEGFALKKCSTFALDAHLVGQTTYDAVAFAYQQGGHTFYQLNFPTLNETWVFDLATDQWHQRSSGGGRHRAQVRMADDKVYVGDYANGSVYVYDPAAYTDNGAAITRTRAFPHIVNDGKRLSYKSFILDMDVSQVPAGQTLSVWWSDDRGNSITATPLTLTFSGPYSSLLLRRLGLARDRVFVVSWSFAYPTSLQGGWVEVEPAET